MTAVDDTLVEGSETIEIAASQGATAIGNVLQIGITDDDEATFSLAADPLTITEQGAGSATVTVSTGIGGAIFASDQIITLTLGGSATATDDYTIVPARITIAANETSGSATVTAVDDTLLEEAETITIAASDGTTPIGSVEITIQDNDVPQFTLSVSATTVAEGENTTVTVETGGVTFADAQTITLTLTGSATATDDYTILPASITITAGETSGSATITVVNDTLLEDAETITIEASRDGASIGSVVEITISASDQTTFSLLLFPEDAEVTEGESATLTVETGGVTFATAQTITLEFTGSATAGEDYTSPPASIELAANETSVSATIETTDDSQVEVDDETITIAASHDGVEIGTRNITIEDNDQANFTLTVTPVIDEGDDAIVTLATGGVVFDSDETITLVLGGNATATEDYTITPASITIAAGQTSGTATLTVVDDAIVEGSETIVITPRHGTTDAATVTVTITDGDAATFSLEVDPDAIAEAGTGSATVTVAITGGVTFATAQTITLELDGSATAAEDYTITPASITIAANETSGSATVTALDDTVVEGEETITIAATHDATPIGSVDVPHR